MTPEKALAEVLFLNAYLVAIDDSKIFHALGSLHAGFVWLSFDHTGAPA
jgi:hypothetical protein